MNPIYYAKKKKKSGKISIHSCRPYLVYYYYKICHSRFGIKDKDNYTFKATT